MIIVHRNFLSEEECSKIILYYEKNIFNSFFYQANETYPFSLMNSSEKFFQQILDRLSKFTSPFFDSLVLSNYEIVKWPPGSLMRNHIDHGDKLGFFIFLNNSYLGGQTIIEEKNIIYPETGKLLCFENGKYIHRVSKVEKNNRFMLSGWYT